MIQNTSKNTILRTLIVSCLITIFICTYYQDYISGIITTTSWSINTLYNTSNINISEGYKQTPKWRGYLPFKEVNYNHIAEYASTQQALVFKQTDDEPASNSGKIAFINSDSTDNSHLFNLSSHNSSIVINYKYQHAYANAINTCGNNNNNNRKHKFKKESNTRKTQKCYERKNGLLYEDLPYRGIRPSPDLQKDLYQEAFKSLVPLKKILYWNELYTQKDFGFGYGQEPFKKARCKEDRCFATSNREAFTYKDIDAVIWHLRSSDHSLPNQRSPHTRYVMLMAESASNTFTNISVYNHVFNWTYTYRLDSDFPNPYGLVLRRKESKNKIKSNVLKTKTKMAAWFVSNCRTESLREKLVNSMKQYIDIDVYGKCGWMRCERKKKQECYEMLERDYKFYLAFENSLCRDYVTEKFFNVLKYNVVPVVYGLGNFMEIAPPHSYINVLDFQDVKSLAEYLQYLDHNNTAYMEYFRWKNDYGVVKGWTLNAVPWCSLCQRLHNDQQKSVYEDIESWFVKESSCRNKNNDRDLLKFVHGTN